MKTCPYCAEEIQDEAIICRFCNRDLVEKQKKKFSVWKSSIFMGICLAGGTAAAVSRNSSSDGPFGYSGYIGDVCNSALIMGIVYTLLIALVLSVINKYGTNGLLSLLLIGLVIGIIIYGLVMSVKNYPPSHNNVPFYTVTPFPTQNNKWATSTPVVAGKKNVTPRRLSQYQIPDFFNAVGVGDNTDKDDLGKFAARHARNLAIPAPYVWEFYDCDEDVTYSQVRSFFDKELRVNNGYRKVFDEPGGNEIYLLKFMKDKELIIIQFWGKYEDQEPAALLFIFVSK